MGKRLTSISIIITLSILFSINTIHAIQPEPSVVEKLSIQDEVSYSYEELLEKTFQNSNDLRSRTKEVKRSEIMREEAAKNKTFTPVGGGYTMEEALASQAIQGLMAADINLKMSKWQIDLEKDRIAYNVRKAFNKVITEKEKNFLAEESKKLKEAELKIAKVQHVQGNISRFQLIAYQNDYNEAIKKLESSKTSLEAAYLELNNFVGFEKNYIYKLNYDKINIETKKEIPSLEIHITRTLNKNPNIWLLEQRVELAELAKELHVYNVGQDPYKAKEIDITTSKITLDSSKQMIEHSLRSMYQSLEQLEQGKEILKINLDNAVKNLEIAELRLDLGMGTEIETKKLRNFVDELEQQLFELELQYQEMLMVYEKPWVISN